MSVDPLESDSDLSDLSETSTIDSEREVSPFEAPDLYYGPTTDPANLHSRWGRLRTRSTVLPHRAELPPDFNEKFLTGDDNGDTETKGLPPKLRQGLFQLRGEGSDDNEGAISDYEDGEEEKSELQRLEEVRKAKMAQIGNVIHPGREKLGKHVKTLLHQQRKSLSLGTHSGGFMSQVHVPTKNEQEVVSGSQSGHTSQEAINLKKTISSPSNSTSYLLPLKNQLRSNMYLNDMPKEGVTSPLNRSVDTLDSTNDDSSENNLTSVPEPVPEPVSRSSSEIPGRSKSFVQRYKKGIDIWNQWTKAGQIGVESKHIPHASRAFAPRDETSNTSNAVPEPTSEQLPSLDASILRRRGSTDASSSKGNSRRFFISDIDATLAQLLANEDTDHNCQITIEDTGPKVLKLGTANSNGFRQYDIRGTYMLSNLLQELAIAKRMGRKQMILDEARLNENPVWRLRRLIRTVFWKNLTRKLTENTVATLAKDTKVTPGGREVCRVYIPHNEPEQYYYYRAVGRKHPEYSLKVDFLPEHITPQWMESVNDRPGFLALAMRHRSGRYGDLEGYPYVVPGGRFNEQYGWDSYFETLGLLKSGQPEPCIGMCQNFIFEILHYGKILNANRSYYLCRSQPPFLTQMVLRIFQYVRLHEHREELDLLKDAITAAITEYHTVWCSEPRLDRRTGLSTYHPSGMGIPPETEPSHFHAVLGPYCRKYGVKFEEFTRMYNSGEIHEPALDEYFVNDRAVRESGHDTTYRLEGICAHLATVDLNSLLYKYEADIAFVIETYFNDHFAMPDGSVEKSASWKLRASQRKERMNKYMWSEEDSLFYDYDVQRHCRISYESVTSLWPMWAGMCSHEQAEKLVYNSIPKFEEFGGLVSGTERSRGRIGVEKPSRQWDYPYAWAPHQMMAWKGLSNYGYYNVARRLAYRWCYMMTLAFVDFNGIVVEKYDATSERQPHKVSAEYGNQGSGFKCVATEGFGWVNASYLLGLGYLDKAGVRALGLVSSPREFFGHMRVNERHAYAIDEDQMIRAREINKKTKEGVEFLESECDRKMRKSEIEASDKKKEDGTNKLEKGEKSKHNDKKDEENDDSVTNESDVERKSEKLEDNKS